MIIRSLSQTEIKKIYPDRKVKPDVGIRPNFDYIVISVESVPELKKNSENSIRYWIVSDERILMPYCAYLFKVIDNSMPKNWVIDMDERGIALCDTKWATPGYVEDYFDNENITAEYKKIMRKIFKESVETAEKNNIKLNLGIKEF